MTIEKRKISLIGTSCVGKTTIFSYFKKQYANSTHLSFVDEAARMYFKKNPLPSGERFTFKHQKEIQSLALELEKQAHNSDANTIFTDCFVLSAPIYLHAQGDIRGSEKLIRNSTDWINTYTTVLVLSPEGVPYKKDDVRNEEKAFRQKAHQSHMEVLRRENIPYTLIEGTLEDRIRSVKQILGSI